MTFYMFLPEFSIKGFAHETGIASINYGYKKLKVEGIIAIIHAEHINSCQLLNKLECIRLSLLCTSLFVYTNSD